jgi:hypothetical protein
MSTELEREIRAQADVLRLAERSGVRVDAPYGLSKVTLTS